MHRQERMPDTQHEYIRSDIAAAQFEAGVRAGLERSGTHHNALDDATSQALHLIAINEVSNGAVL